MYERHLCVSVTFMMFSNHTWIFKTFLLDVHILAPHCNVPVLSCEIKPTQQERETFTLPLSTFMLFLL